MNLFIRELKANQKALIIWSVCMALLVLSGLAKYTAYSSSGNTGNEVFDQLPNTLKILLGFSGFEVSKISSFYAFLFPYIEITTAIHAALIGSGIIAKEERDKTTEFLIAKPISRKTIITAKLLAALFNVIIINLVSLLSSFVIVPTFHTGENITNEIIILHIIMFILQLIFLTLGSLLSASLRKSKAASSIATNIVILGYVISKITALVDYLDVLNICSPFTYFSLDKAVNSNEISLLPTLLSLMIILVFASFTYFFFQKRDMSI